MFSVIIPLYNKANDIEKAVNSVLYQTFMHFELIIINDGSTDDSLIKIEKFKDERIKIISQQNSGVSFARNNGVKAANNEYIAFLDADDWWHPNFLEEMDDLIKKWSDAGLYGSSYFLVKNGKSKSAQIGIENGFRAGYINYFKVYAESFWVPINCSFVVVKKSVYDKIGGFKESIKFGEDFDLWVRIALKYKVAYVNKNLAYSNQDADTRNRALGNDKLWKQEEHIIFHLDYLKNYENNNTDLKKLLDGLRVRALLPFYLKGRYTGAIQYILTNIDFNTQPLLYRFIYQSPKIMVLVYFYLKKLGSVLKQNIIKKIISTIKFI